MIAALASVQGVLEAVRISLAGYPTRRTYSEFIDRFGILVPELMDGRYIVKISDESILFDLFYLKTEKVSAL